MLVALSLGASGRAEPACQLACTTCNPANPCFCNPAAGFPQVLLARRAADPGAVIKSDGQQISLLQHCFLQNRAMWYSCFEYCEETGRMVG